MQIPCNVVQYLHRSDERVVVLFRNVQPSWEELHEKISSFPYVSSARVQGSVIYFTALGAIKGSVSYGRILSSEAGESELGIWASLSGKKGVKFDYMLFFIRTALDTF
jgi:hypothetical protein